MAEVKLIASSLSLFCTRIEWALKLKVHVLVHNGKLIAESLIVLEYIDETWKDSSLLPEDPYKKAMARFWAKFTDEKIGYLDLAFGWIPHWLNVMEEVGCLKLADAQRFLLLHQWAEDFIGTPLIKECLPPRDKLVEHLAAGINYLRSLAASQQ
ncbi:hypothetical protein CRYUN_Cryun07bG0078700 [Craigia yunnanensis]